MRKSNSFITVLYKIFKYNAKIQKFNGRHPKNLLTYKSCYHFVNLPTSSQYYHKQLPNSIDASMRMVEKQNKLNEKCFLLEHIVQLVDINPKFLSYSTKQFLIKQLSKWKNQQGRMQRVASVAWVIHKMKLKDQLADLYEQIFQRILNDQWYVDFFEAVKAIQAYSTYPNMQRRNLLLEKVQRNINISISDFNMTYYQKICISLIQAERYRSPLWQKLEQYVIRNLSMPYTARTFFDIFKSFAISQNGTQQFYQICQQVIRKGHLQSITHRIRSNLGDFDSSGDYFALMIDTYATVQKNTPFRLSGDFLDYVYKSLLTSKLEYKDISSLTKIIKGMPQLQFYPQQVSRVVNDIINNKEFSYYQNLNDIQQLYFVLDEFVGFIPEKLDLNIQRLIIKDIQRNILPLPISIDLVGFMLMFRQRNQKIEKKSPNSSKLIQSLNKSLEKRYKYLQPQQAKMVRQMLSATPALQSHVNKKLLLLKGTQTD